MRQGKSVAETNELVKDSVILSKIGQLEASEATKYLTSAMNGYKVATEDVIGVVDKLSAVDLASATSAGGLAESMSKTANSAQIAGVSMDNLIGYIATVTDVSQKSASVVGESFKTIFSRMGKVSVGDFIDDDGTDMTKQINQVEGILGKLNIKLRDSADEFRDFEDVIYDVGMAWDSFTSVEKNAIAAGFGGVYQRENVLTLFRNFDKAMKLSEISANSAGTALKKFAIYENGLEAATNRLTASFESLAYNTVNSDFMKGLADGAASIVEFVDKTKLIQTGLTALTFTGIIKGLLLFGTKIVAVKNNMNAMTTAMNLSTKATERTRAENILLGQSYANLTPKQQRLLLSNKKLNMEQKIAILSTTGLSRAQAKAKLQAMGLATATGKAANATFSLRGAWETLKLSIASNPIGLIVTVLTSATLIYSVKQTGDGGYTIDKNALQRTAIRYGEGKNDETDEAHNPYKSEYEKSQQKVASLKQQLAELQSKSSDPRIASNGVNQAISEIESQLTEAEKELAANETLYNSYQNLINSAIDTSNLDKIWDDLKEITDETNSKVGDYNTSIKNLSNAIDSMNSNAPLTYDEMTKLVEDFPTLNGLIKEGTDGFYIETETLKSLRDETYTTRNQFIEDEKAKTQAAISEAQNRIKVWEIELNIYKQFGENYDGEIKTIQGYIDSASENLLSLENYITLLDSMKKNVYDSSKSTSSKDTLSDELQQELDYYDDIIKGIEVVTDKRIDAINKEIEAINEQKDTLKEQNDERQREIDLIDAQNNLEKAKKQKVFVYKEGQGLVQVQDEKAVKEAQQELDDVQRDIKEAEYDKQIDLLEQQSKVTEEFKDTFSNMKSDIEDIIAVEQAKTALDTDENGLLTLDKSAIDGIQNGLAKAVVNKGNEDNKENPYYQKVTWDDLMKKLGSNATMEEFRAAFYPTLNTMQPALAYDVQGKTNYQYVTNNNGTTNFTANFNISEATDADKVAKVVKTEITGLLQKTYNKIK